VSGIFAVPTFAAALKAEAMLENYWELAGVLRVAEQVLSSHSDDLPEHEAGG
jgi:hypothetical protein